MNLAQKGNIQEFRSDRSKRHGHCGLDVLWQPVRSDKDLCDNRRSAEVNMALPRVPCWRRASLRHGGRNHMQYVGTSE